MNFEQILPVIIPEMSFPDTLKYCNSVCNILF